MHATTRAQAHAQGSKDECSTDGLRGSFRDLGAPLVHGPMVYRLALWTLNPAIAVRSRVGPLSFTEQAVEATPGTSMVKGPGACVGIGEHRGKGQKIGYTSRFVRVILAQGPC